MWKFSLLKYLQKTKWVSRREFVEMIKQEVITINWDIVNSIDCEIKIWDSLEVILEWTQNYSEKITKFPTFKPVMVIFNKPKWYTVAKEDKFNKTIYDLLPESWRKDFFYIWRLDKDSHWLLLLTNEPKLVDYYENPKNRIFKIYEVIIDKDFKTKDLQKAKKWLVVDEEWYSEWAKNFNPKIKNDELSFYDIHYKYFKGKYLLRVVLKEWKKRHIRRLLKALWYKTLDLKRIKFWKYELWNIKLWKYMISKV